MSDTTKKKDLADPSVRVSKSDKWDATETRKWFESLEFVLEYILKNQGSERAPFFVDNLVDRLHKAGIEVPPIVSTPYVNTIPVEEQPAYPGDLENGAADQELYPLERHGHGRERQS